MEHLLTKLARQLDTLDEASLMALWDKYAATVGRFEPSRRWEEAALIFSLIQAKRWKNQLFNYYWAQQARPRDDGPPPQTSFTLEPPRSGADGDAGAPAQKRCKVLSFRPVKSD